ncbi:MULTISPECIES: hypothetical protein [unclassified Butyrivibrio]|uniref:hypothetical protein n=1 Tax=unclassified Butyrivibrio TaxID=2639466 RepID=UPI0004155228|nr:hypothetical protein [Butyrivibrio sp. MB2005]
MGKFTERENAIMEKLSIMIDIMMAITDYSYSDCYDIITNTRTYQLMVDGDVSALHDSPQASLVEVGKDIRESGNAIGNSITSENIKKYISEVRSLNKELAKI